VNSWPEQRGRFTKVMPRDFKRVLELTQQAVSEGIDPLALVMGGGRG
jgi:glutamate synthase (NADPH/NADH) large chain